MKILKRYIDYLHLKTEVIPEVKIAEYKKTKKMDLSKLHLSYLKELREAQRERQTNIENKNSQIVGQASIIVSITALFVPLIIDKLSGLHFSIILSFLFCFSLILFHYVVAIVHAVKTLQINHYKYSTRSTRTVTKEDRATTEANFLKEEINDLIWLINKNSIQNNRKANNLVYATRSFRIATILLALFTVVIIVFGSILKKGNEIIEVKTVREPIEINNEKIIQVIKKLDKSNELEIIGGDLNEIKTVVDSINRRMQSYK